MLASKKLLRGRLGGILRDKKIQGHQVEGLDTELENLPDSYDAIAEFAVKLRDLPMKEDWVYNEPSELDEIWAEADPDRPLNAIAEISPEDAAAKAEAAFLGAVAGCILGKPLEVNPTLEEIKTAGEKTGEWPINDYITVELLEHIGRKHGSWEHTTRGNIDCVVPDDDLNYTTIGMLVLEQHGIDFTKEDLKNIWLENLPVRYVFGPERKILLDAGFDYTMHDEDYPLEDWAAFMNPGDELCGAQIRADAYGYACPGRPALAAEFAWRDASLTHRRTGIYSTMFTSAAIACAFVAGDDRLAPFETALQFVPQKSRFCEITADCIRLVKESSGWEEAYEKINGRYGEFRHCQVYQETGFLINAMAFAKDVGEGICIAVSQGADTDCFGEIAGSLLGAYFGPGYLEDRWLDLFNDKYYTSLGMFREQSLTAVAKRMGALPGIVEEAKK